MLDKNTERRKLDDIDRDIIKALRKQPKLTNAGLAKKLGLSKSTVGIRLVRLWNSHLVRVVGVMKPNMTGYSVNAWLLIQAKSHKINSIARDLGKIGGIVSVNSLLGPFNILVTVMARDLAHLAEIAYEDVRAIEGINEVHSYLWLSVEKQDLDIRPIRLSSVNVKKRIEEINKTGFYDTLDEFDRTLLAEYEYNGRTSYRDLSRTYNVPESTVRARTNRLCAEGILDFTTIVDPAVDNLNVWVILFIKVDYRRIDEVLAQLARLKQIYFLANTAGSIEIIASARYTDRDEFARVTYEDIQSIPGVVRVEAYEIIKTFKYGFALGFSASPNLMGKGPRKRRQRNKQ